MTHPLNKLRDEFQEWIENGIWQGEDAYTKNFAVGNVSDWWLSHIADLKKELVRGVGKEQSPKGWMESGACVGYNTARTHFLEEINRIFGDKT